MPEEVEQLGDRRFGGRESREARTITLPRDRTLPLRQLAFWNSTVR